VVLSNIFCLFLIFKMLNCWFIDQEKHKEGMKDCDIVFEICIIYCRFVFIT
jgi:hypothetical protein